MSVEDLLQQGIDFHTHSAPSLYNRAIDDFGLAEEAKAAGMRGVVLKAHECPTVGRAALVTSRIDGIKAFGGVVLNYYVGGFNPAAVEAALKLGGKIVWFPTFHAQNQLDRFGRKHLADTDVALDVPEAGLSVLDHDGKLSPGVEPVLGKIAEANAILETGHISRPEILVLVDTALAIGVKKILITHSDMTFTGLTQEDQVQLARKGVFLEKCLLAVFEAFKGEAKPMADSIREIGADRCVLVTDLGQAKLPHPVEGMQSFIKLLLAAGISREEIRTMLADNPGYLLGL